MAVKRTKGPVEKRVRKVSYGQLHKLAAGIALLAFFVIALGGLLAGSSLFSVTFKAFIAMMAVGLISRVVIRILATYEEMNSGKA